MFELDLGSWVGLFQGLLELSGIGDDVVLVMF